MPIFHRMLSYLIILLAIFKLSRGSSLTNALYRPDGRLGQVELAIKATNRGGNVIAVKNNKYAVVVSWSPKSNDFELPIRKMKKMTRFCGVIASGIEADINYIVNKYQDEVNRNRYFFDSDMNLARLGKLISDDVNAHTRSTYHRPFAMRLCIMGYNDAKKSPCLYEIDPYGYLYDCNIISLGPLSEKIPSEWSVDDLESINSHGPYEMIRKCLKSLTSCMKASDDTSTLAAVEIEIAVVGEDIPLSHLSADVIRLLLDEKHDGHDALAGSSMKQHLIPTVL